MATKKKTTGGNGTATVGKQGAAVTNATATRTLPHLSVAERIARGKAARAEVPRSSHASFEPSPTRADPVDLLELQAKTRVPELVPIRYGRMLVSPFTFYRGAAMIMAHDLAATPRSGLNVQCCGDAHLSNFGVFASPERRLVFDLNDFDETLHGPWEWDVKRLAVSMLIAARDNSFSVKDQDRIVLDDGQAVPDGDRRALPEWAISRSGTRTSTSRAVMRGVRLAVQARGSSRRPRRRRRRPGLATACRPSRS